MLELMTKMIEDAKLTVSSADDCGSGYFKATTRETITFGGVDMPRFIVPLMTVEIMRGPMEHAIYVTLQNAKQRSLTFKVIDQEFYTDQQCNIKPVAY